MCLVEQQSVRDLLSNAAAEHILVEAIKDERGERLLQIVILCRVDSNDSWPLAFPQALRGLSNSKETIVGELLEPPKQRAQPTVRFWIGAQYLYKSPEGRFRKIGWISTTDMSARYVRNPQWTLATWVGNPTVLRRDCGVVDIPDTAAVGRRSRGAGRAACRTCCW